MKYNNAFLENYSTCGWSFRVCIFCDKYKFYSAWRQSDIIALGNSDIEAFSFSGIFIRIKLSEGQ